MSALTTNTSNIPSLHSLENMAAVSDLEMADIINKLITEEGDVAKSTFLRRTITRARIILLHMSEKYGLFSPHF